MMACCFNIQTFVYVLFVLLYTFSCVISDTNGNVNSVLNNVQDEFSTLDKKHDRIKRSSYKPIISEREMRRSRTKKKENRRKIAISAVEKIVEEKLTEQLRPLATALGIIRLDTFSEGIVRQLSDLKMIQSKLLTEYGELRAAVNEVGRHTLDLGRQVAGLEERLSSLDRQLPHRMDVTSGRSDFLSSSSSRLTSPTFGDVAQASSVAKDVIIAIASKIASSERRIESAIWLSGNETTEAMKSAQRQLERRTKEAASDVERRIRISMDKLYSNISCSSPLPLSSSSSPSDRFFRRHSSSLKQFLTPEVTRDELVYLPAEERSTTGRSERDQRQNSPLVNPFSGWIRPVGQLTSRDSVDETTVTKIANEVAKRLSSESESLIPRDCSDIWRRGERNSAVYTIFPASCSRRFAVRVWCELEGSVGSAGGGWTVIQRRGRRTTDAGQLPTSSPSSVDFYRDWADYKWGFGDLNGEYWLGNEYIHALTQSGDYDLRVQLSDWPGDARWALYTHFAIENEGQNYTLRLGEYTGNAGNSLKKHAGAGFSTRDRDHDSNPRANCATTFHGAWWFTSCHESHLNGRYRNEVAARKMPFGDGINWSSFRGHTYSLKSAVMMIRPAHQRQKFNNHK